MVENGKSGTYVVDSWTLPSSGALLNDLAGPCWESGQALLLWPLFLELGPLVLDEWALLVLVQVLAMSTDWAGRRGGWEWNVGQGWAMVTMSRVCRRTQENIGEHGNGVGNDLNMSHDRIYHIQTHLGKLAQAVMAQWSCALCDYTPDWGFESLLHHFFYILIDCSLFK